MNTKSSATTWNTDEAEGFAFLGSSWDVQAAKRVIVSKPRNVERVKVADLAPFLGTCEPTGNGGFRVTAGIMVDRERAATDPTIDLSVPLIAITTAQGNALPIDGWHRVARAVAEGISDLPIVFLNRRESKSVEC